MNYYEITKSHADSFGLIHTPKRYAETLDGLSIMVGENVMIRDRAHNPVGCAACGNPYGQAAAIARVHDPAIYNQGS